MVFISVLIIIKTIFDDEEKYRAEGALGTKRNYLKNKGFILKYSQPFFKRYILSAVFQIKLKKETLKKYKRSIANAGLNDLLTPEEFIAFKLFLVLGFPIIFLALRIFLDESWPLSLIPILSVFGFFYPNIWIKGLYKKRTKEITNGLPFIVDMLALSIEAGLDFLAAMQKVISKSPPSPIVDEFKTLINETKIGASRAEALRNLSWRTNIPIMTSFCATLIAADSVGASVGPILKVISNEIREKRSNQIEEEGAKASSKILLPMIFFIIPAVFIVIAVPIVIEALSSSSEGVGF